MIVCVCNRISDSDIAEAVAAGASTVDDVQFQLGVGTCCGQCMEYAESFLQEAKQGLFYSAA